MPASQPASPPASQMLSARLLTNTGTAFRLQSTDVIPAPFSNLFLSLSHNPLRFLACLSNNKPIYSCPPSLSLSVWGGVEAVGVSVEARIIHPRGIHRQGLARVYLAFVQAYISAAWHFGWHGPWLTYTNVFLYTKMSAAPANDLKFITLFKKDDTNCFTVEWLSRRSFR